MDIFTVKERIESMSDDELINAATRNKQEYTLDALQIINAVLTKRNIPVKVDMTEVQKGSEIRGDVKGKPVAIRIFVTLNILTAAVLFVFALMGMSGTTIDFPIIGTVGILMCCFSIITIYLNNKYKKEVIHQKGVQ